MQMKVENDDVAVLKPDIKKDYSFENYKINIQDINDD